MTNFCAYPLLHIFHLHIRYDDSGLCVLGVEGGGWWVAEMHIQKALRPRNGIVLLTIPGCLPVISVEVIVLVQHCMFLELKIHRECANGLGHGADALAKCRTYKLWVRQFQSPHRMGIRNNDVAGYELASIDLNTYGMRVVTQYSGDFAGWKDATTFMLDGAYHGLCNSIAPAHNTIGTLVVKVHDEGMAGKRCLVAFCSIQRKRTHQHFCQFGIRDDTVDYFIDWT